MTILGLASALLGVIGLLLKWYLDPKRRAEHDINDRKAQAEEMGKELYENSNVDAAMRLSDEVDRLRSKGGNTPKR